MYDSFCFVLLIGKGSTQFAYHWSEALYSLRFLRPICYSCFLRSLKCLSDWSVRTSENDDAKSYSSDVLE